MRFKPKNFVVLHLNWKLNIMQRPFICTKPRKNHLPVIYNSPHSGRIYDGNFLRQSALSFKEIRISEDFYVDTLLDSVVDYGAFLLEASFPRSFVDVNRAASDLDQNLILDLDVKSMNPKTAAGLGVIPRIVGDGVEIYPQKLNLKEVNRRLDLYYFPYHNQLQKLINQAIENFGVAILFDIHSMPHSCLESLDSAVSEPPQIVLGDCFGTSCDPWFSQAVFDVFDSEGFVVRKNCPFSGGFITKNYGVSEQNVQVIQIEIDRSLYMDEVNFTLKSGFFDLKKKLQKIFDLLSDIGGKKSLLVQAAE